LKQIDVVFPTKNRVMQLISAIESVVAQGNYVNKIIIIDQSDKNNLVLLKNKFLKIYAKRIVYKYMPKIKGLVEAKSFSLNYISSPYVSFLEDDVIVKKDFYKNLLNSFQKNPNMVGSSGVIDNHPKFSLIYLLFFYMFHIGIHFDLRPLIYGHYLKHKKLICSSKISGGISMWKKQIFDQVKFDTKNFFHYIEDVEFSERVYRLYPLSLFINTDSHADHNVAINSNLRASKSKQIFYKIIEYKIFYKKHRSFFNFLCTQWLFVGFLLESLYYCFKFKTISPLKNYLDGIFSNDS
jgi:GT2 family glycosyltransferase